MNIYISCALMGLLGLLLSTITVIQSLKNKAKIANVIFTVSSYFKDDGVLTMAGSSVMIIMGLVVLEYVPPSTNPLLLIAIFATAGYTGSDLASRFFSVANKRINDAIDYKTTIADKASGTLDNPTPTTK